MTPYKIACPFCGKETGAAGVRRHARTCPGNPDVALELTEFVYAHSRGGLMMTYQQYDAAVAGRGLPSVGNIRRYFGSWQAFAAWCGLKSSPRGRSAHAEMDNPDVPLVAETCAPTYVEGLPAVRSLRCVREWNPRTHSYTPVGWQEVYAIR